MQKIVIADDDEILLEGLTNAFDWHTLGITVAASVADGLHALKAVKASHADILLTDIRMPHMDGLSLARELGQLGYDTTVVIMSAYNDFSYAQEAIRLAAVDYILKPVDLTVLREILSKIVSSRNSHVQQEEKLQKMKSYNAAAREKDFFCSVLQKKYTEKECLEKADNIIQVENLSWQILEVVADNKGLQADTAFRQLLFSLTDHVHWKWIDLHATEHLICCIAEEDALAETVSQLKELCKAVVNDRYPDATLSFINGIVVHNIYELYRSYENVCKIREYLYNETGNVDLSESDVEQYYNEHRSMNKMLIAKLAQSAVFGETESLRKYLEKFSYNLKHSGSNSQLMLTFALSVFLVELNDLLKEQSVPEDISQRINDIYSSYHLTILSQGKLSHAISDLQGMITAMAKQIQLSDTDNGQNLISRAVDYINCNYSDPDLRIYQVADFVSLSQNYFSVQFKKTTGYSFTDYLARKRIEKAQDYILNTALSNTEIASKIGFNNPNYFSTAFKKYTGLTISQFRKHIEK